VATSALVDTSLLEARFSACDENYRHAAEPEAPSAARLLLGRLGRTSSAHLRFACDRSLV